MPFLNYTQAIASAIITGLIAYGLHSISMSFAEASKHAALDAQAAELNGKCAKEKLKTKEANDALQKTARDIAAKLTDYKRLHPDTCVPVIRHAEPAASGDGYAGKDGISSDWLREYAAECESYRQQRIILEEFLR